MIVSEYKKRYMCLFKNGKLVEFGNKNCYIHHKDKEKRFTWIRENASCDWWNPYDPKCLERYLLWEMPTLIGGIRNFKKLFGDI